jgi:phosphate-selective porin OprO/OprP
MVALAPTLASANPPAPTPPKVPPRASLTAPRWERAWMAERKLGDRATYKPGAGITVRTPDGRFSLNFTGWAQLLLSTRRDQTPAAGASSWATSLELRRARLILQGNVFSKYIRYYVHLMFAPKDLGFKDGVPHRAPIFQWYSIFSRFSNANVQAGFFFVPYARQRMQPLPRLQMVDNSPASYEFTLDQDIGVQVSSPDVAGLGKLRYFAGVFMGEGYDWYKAGDFGLTYVGRVDVLPFGMFEDYVESDLERPARPKISIGAAYAFSDRDHRTRAISGASFADGGTMSSHNVTADVTLKWAGLSILADVYWRRGWRQGGGLTDTDALPIPVQAARNGFGWTAQMGLYVPRTRFEVVARSAGARPVRSVATSLARLDEVGGGFNYYFYRHMLKLQLDYIHTWGPALPTGRGDLMRLQLQLSF